MRSLNRNEKTYYYALYGQEIDEVDNEGNFTGETTIGYGNPVEFKANISPSKGEAKSEQFGINLDYDKIICSCDVNLPIDETTVLWVDTMPVLAQDGTTATKRDYIVKKVAKSLNSVQYAIKKVG